MHTSSHSPRALLLFDTNDNVCFVLCPTLRMHGSVHRCTHMETVCSHKHIRTQAHTQTHTHTHTSGSMAKPKKLSKPQFRGNGAIPRRAFPTRNDSISPLADCTYDTFSSHFVKQAHSALHSNTDDMHPFSFRAQSQWNKGPTKKHVKKDTEKDKKKKKRFGQIFGSRMPERRGKSLRLSVLLGRGWKFSFN